MNFVKVMWRLVLCGLFVIGLTYGLSAHATEPEGHEKAVHETHEGTEAVEHEEAQTEEAHETEAEEGAHGEEETHETKGEGQH